MYDKIDFVDQDMYIQEMIVMVWDYIQMKKRLTSRLNLRLVCVWYPQKLSDNWFSTVK